MNRWTMAVVLPLVAWCGCRSGGNQELLERELRIQEDRIYQLEANLCQYKDELEAYRQENDDLRTQNGQPAAPAQSPSRPSRTAPSELPVPNVQLPEQAAPFAQPPEISPPDLSPPMNPPAGKAPMPLSPPSIDLPEGASRQSSEPPGEAIDPGQITRITLDPQRTGGYDADQHPGDEGVSVFIQPRGASGEVLRSAGKISIVAMDELEQGDAARLARWNFTEEEAAEHFHPSPDGLQFQLRWPERLPRHEHLTLHVRFTRPDGQKLDVEQSIRVVLPGSSPGWTRSEHPTIRTVPLERSSPAATRVPGAGDIEAREPSAVPPDAPRDRTADRSPPQWMPYR